MPARVAPARVHPGCRTEARISLRYEILQRYHVNAKRPPIPGWNRSAGRLERVAHAWCLRLYISTWSVPSKWPSHHVNVIRNQKVIPVWNSRRCNFSHVNTSRKTRLSVCTEPGKCHANCVLDFSSLDFFLDFFPDFFLDIFFAFFPNCSSTFLTADHKHKRLIHR